MSDRFARDCSLEEVEATCWLTKEYGNYVEVVAISP